MKSIVLKGAVLLLILLVKHCALDLSQRCFPCAHKELFCSRGSFLHALTVSGP